ncbi:unnamed protein product [Ilex paraguariensis]|uniref:Protein kinase domain-containing protein n=1 Tax=Ilex paraguariensis TaxID=185542 RepID=A0ABC8UIP5_9AQUA
MTSIPSSFSVMPLSCLLFFLILLPFKVNSQIPESERLVLLKMKEQWGNPLSLQAWNSTSQPCDWWGIWCERGRVVGIDLRQNNIPGTIPMMMCELENLRYITLSDNKIAGRIPESLSNCSELEELDLTKNFLTGPIPSGLFRLKRLRSLILKDNKLSGELPIPIELFNLASLDLSRNNLSGFIPKDFGKLHSLSLLDLSNNSLSGSIPNGLFLLKNLISVSLAHNSLSGGIPTSIDSLILEEMNLSHNHLKGSIPEGVGELPSLSSLDLSHNQLSGDIISTVTHFRPNFNSINLRLCSNKLSGRIPYVFVRRAYISSCFDYSNLCSANKTRGLRSCPSKLCSDKKFEEFLRCPIKKPKSKKDIIIPATIGALLGVGFIVIIYLCLARKSWSKKHVSHIAEWEMICFKKLDFTEWSILSSLSDNNLIGTGGSGKVYRIPLNQTGKYVAVKWIWNDRKPGHRLEKEFLAEIQTLGSICHANIVKLLCYISSKNTKLLVYEYMENQSLDRWLHGRKLGGVSSDDNSAQRVVLDWPTRLQIAIRVAQGLSYMHHDCSPPIIHRDIKSSNILLDSELCAKISDFGLAKLLAKKGDPETASAVAGTFGYIAPEYAHTAKVNVKSDVYSFGVVLLELATGREAVTQDDHINLAEWAWRHYTEENSIIDALDEEIKEACFLEEMSAVFNLGLLCTATSPSIRPSMREVSQILHNCALNRSC